jgi:rubrerythrin
VKYRGFLFRAVLTAFSILRDMEVRKMKHKNLKDETNETLQCKGCGKPFLFTKGERNFYLNKGLQIPKRCPECRAQRKAMIDSQGGGE